LGGVREIEVKKMNEETWKSDATGTAHAFEPVAEAPVLPVNPENTATPAPAPIRVFVSHSGANPFEPPQRTELYTTAQAAKIVGTSYQSIHNLVKMGHLKFAKVKTTRFKYLTAGELRKFLSKPVNRAYYPGYDRAWLGK
jgi:hypothetical protein